MEQRRLGSSDLHVSKLCLGTMTFGNQNTEAQSHEQLDYAFSHGINFLDAAEMYPVPTAAELQGRTEAYIGNWLQKKGNRDQVVIATKAAGPSDMTSYLRPNIHFDRENIELAIEGSLSRLKTDYIDLYQLHWPDRVTTFFGQLDYRHRPESDGTSIEETLKVLKAQVDAGKIRYIGLSNETPWGVMSFLKYAEMFDLPTVVSVQNPYSLLNRVAETGLSEVLHREQVSLLPYSPLGFGVLSGKYLDGQLPEGSRMALFPQFNRYFQPEAIRATKSYVELARKFSLDPAQMALAFVTAQPFVASNIIGATNVQQLASNIASAHLELSDELLVEIAEIHKRYPNPAP